MFYWQIDEMEYPIAYSADVLAHQKAILEAAANLTGEGIAMFEKTISIIFGQRIRIEYDWIGHRNELFLATRDDAFMENTYNEDMYYDYEDERYDPYDF